MIKKELTPEEKEKLIDDFFQGGKVTTGPKDQKKIVELIWKPEHCVFLVKGNPAICADEKVGFQFEKNWYLFPEEALYMYNKGKAELYMIQDNNTKLINTIHVLDLWINSKKDSPFDDLNIHKCFEFMKKNGFHLKRFSLNLKIDSMKEGEETLSKKVKTEAQTETQNYLENIPVYNVYATNKEYFSKTISYHLIVVDMNMPLLKIDQILRIKQVLGVEKLKAAIVSNEDVIIYDIGELK